MNLQCEILHEQFLVQQTIVIHPFIVHVHCKQVLFRNEENAF